MAYLAPGHRVAFNRGDWFEDGPAYVLGSVTGAATDEPDDDLYVKVIWDDGTHSVEPAAESEWVQLATVRDWYWTTKIETR